MIKFNIGWSVVRSFLSTRKDTVLNYEKIMFW